LLTRCKLLGISQGAKEGSKGVARYVLVVVALVSHLTRAPHASIHPRIVNRSFWRPKDWPWKKGGN
jgi:hypothetical protein